MAGGPRSIFRFRSLRPPALGVFARASGALVPLSLAWVLAGCSVSFPISPLLSPGSKEDSVDESPKASFADLLDSEDWRRAKAALSTALDPQGNGSLVGWENPASGNKGSFVPLSKPYPSDAKICRVFLAKVDRKGAEESMQGTACANKQGEWSIAEAKPWKKV